MNWTQSTTANKLELDCVTVVGSWLPPTCVVQLYHPLIRVSLLKLYWPLTYFWAWVTTWTGLTRLNGSRLTSTVVDKMQAMCLYINQLVMDQITWRTILITQLVWESYQNCVCYVWIASCQVHSGWFCTYKACFCSGRFGSLVVQALCTKLCATKYDMCL